MGRDSTSSLMAPPGRRDFFEGGAIRQERVKSVELAPSGLLEGPQAFGHLRGGIGVLFGRPREDGGGMERRGRSQRVVQGPVWLYSGDGGDGAQARGATAADDEALAVECEGESVQAANLASSRALSKSPP